ncbi:hypothetical protein [Corynebacterium sp. ACRQP]|uniref:hypothetical protein n=1 Tax=Corynebacterium sp. ACRQP TaxID=2918195 RepID=UPI001EF6508A|nr:hypothetical protein [Corynebacterium sp. ACRQP]MCG7235256.1 hypothetical protein [Corynebacterium sp. ACRQP]
MAQIAPISIRDVMSHCPIDLNLKPEAGGANGYAFTLNGVENSPAYREPSNLAAWFIGYVAGQAAADNTKES